MQMPVAEDKQVAHIWPGGGWPTTAAVIDIDNDFQRSDGRYRGQISKFIVATETQFHLRGLGTQPRHQQSLPIEMGIEDWWKNMRDFEPMKPNVIQHHPVQRCAVVAGPPFGHRPQTTQELIAICGKDREPPVFRFLGEIPCPVGRYDNLQEHCVGARQPVVIDDACDVKVIHSIYN